MYQGFSIQSSLNFEGFEQIQIVINTRTNFNNFNFCYKKNSKRKTAILKFDLIKNKNVNFEFRTNPFLCPTQIACFIH